MGTDRPAFNTAARASLLTVAMAGACERPNGLGRLETGFTTLYRGGQVKPERYAPCPCGSGKKFKFCCHLNGT